MSDQPEFDPNDARPEASRTDPEELRTRLQAWLRGLPDVADDAVVQDLVVPDGNGMSSETLLFDLAHDGQVEHLVARVAPRPESVPVFPDYDMGMQFRVMQEVASAVPVPAVRWLEEDPGPVGAAFFVMERVEGRVPPDVMPYNFGIESWLYDASPEEQRHLQDRSVEVLAALHALPVDRFGFLDDTPEGADPAERSALRRHVDATRGFYEWVVADQRPSPLIERAFAWLEDHWPDDEGETVLSWGDSRIGNMMFDGFDPVAVLDWEMASLGPREVDLSWMVFLHRFFEEVAWKMELPGMRHFMHAPDVVAHYEQVSGHAVQNLEWHTTYAALRHAAIMYRVAVRTITFGQGEWPEDVDDLIMHRAALEQLLDGTYEP
jgi:aminoglycoside phosphotransferase (APT) family kinase protein